jgi:hypothetical protein
VKYEEIYFIALLWNMFWQWKFPFLQGKSPLTSDNNAAFKLNAGLSPIIATWPTKKG